MSNAEEEHRVTLHGSEHHCNLRQRLWEAVTDDSMTELELVDFPWEQRDEDGDKVGKEEGNSQSHLSLDDVRQTLAHRPFDKLLLQGEHGQIPLDYPVSSISLRQVHFTTPYRLQFNHKRLKDLSLISMSLSDIFIASLAQLVGGDNVVLEKLDLSDSRMFNDGPVTLGRALASNQSLKHLSLSECNLQDGPLSHILHGLRSHPSIQHLDTSFNKCGSDSEAIPQLRQILQNTRTLKFLNIGFCAYGSGRQVDLSPILHCLSDRNEFPDSLKTLQIAGNNLRDENMDGIVTLLVQNDQLEQLDLSSNRFSDAAIKSLARHLGHMKRLRVLDLQENGLTEEGVRHLLDYITSNTRVEAIELDETLSNTRNGRYLALHLDLNWGGERVLSASQQHSIPLSLWPSILARANNWDAEKLSFEREPSSEDIISHFLKKVHFFCTSQATS